ncbi:hypothetical protein NFI96_007270 [Prochilodus magdalenae]|nr:hypothetical protein NFI96_007270 [Prochilodus magdalenae]
MDSVLTFLTVTSFVPEKKALLSGTCLQVIYFCRGLFSWPGAFAFSACCFMFNAGRPWSQSARSSEAGRAYLLHLLTNDSCAEHIRSLAAAAGNYCHRRDLPEKLTPNEITPEEITPSEITPEEISPKEITPEELTPAELTPNEITPEEITPAELTPNEITPEEITPEEITPKEITPKEITPKKITSKELTPKKVTPEEVTPEEVTPEEVTPKEVTPEEITPKEITPEPRLTRETDIHTTDHADETPDGEGRNGRSIKESTAR